MGTDQARRVKKGLHEEVIFKLNPEGLGFAYQLGKKAGEGMIQAERIAPKRALRQKRGCVIQGTKGRPLRLDPSEQEVKAVSLGK